MAGVEESSRLPPLIETTIYRVVQEALTNVARHSGATTVSVIIERRVGQVCTIIEDDGCGFDPGATAAGGSGLGLEGIRERVGLLGGTLEIESQVGRSTLYLKIPLAQP
jgi:signal transduction histidine kinase